MANEKLTKVELTCIYSLGKGSDPGPGDVIEVDAAEAKRLIEIGGAKAYEPAKAAE